MKGKEVVYIGRQEYSVNVKQARPTEPLFARDRHAFIQNDTDEPRF